ncbi:MAG: hypothetical protein LAT76_09230 [Schleiferiaceae bacterium]|nr:hypothetical protein [Schleiferiaceae bacterium]
MRSLHFSRFVAACIFTAVFSCSDDERICTEEFRIVSVTIVGDSLDAAITVRTATSDTLNYSEWNLPPFSFAVADDNLTQSLEGKIESFLFVGFKNSQIKVSQLYELTSDGCHIRKVSGPDTLQL